MDLSNFRIPRLPDDIIRQHADEFRNIYWSKKIPVDVELIAEKAGIDLVPIPALRFICNLEACISNNSKTIYYDPSANEFRLRFSISHELGHHKMHAKELQLMNPVSYEDWHRIIEEIPTHTFNSFEYQANEFAGRLLVPIEALRDSFKEVKDELLFMKEFIYNDYYLAYNFIAKDLSKIFNISEDAMLIRLGRERENPYEYI